MTDRPIIFSAPMVNALLAGRKTQTRRLAWKRDDAAACWNATPWYDLHMEWQFRPITGFFDYLAGRDGLIYSMKGGQPPKAMKGTPSSRGYLTVSLCGKDGIRTKAVHRLVAEAWFGPCPTDGWEVRHLNGDRTDNRIENLDWGSVAENWSDRRALGRGIHEEHHAAKITMADASAIRASSLSQRKLATQYGLSQSTIWDIKAGRAWMPAAPASGRNMALPPPVKLWVREAWGTHRACTGLSIADAYATAGPSVACPRESPRWEEVWKTDEPTWDPRPSIHMPRWASRLTLRVTEVRVQQLQDIGLRDTWAEGCEVRQFWLFGADQQRRDEIGRNVYRGLWEELHGRGSWEGNPAVVALTFQVIPANIDTLTHEAAA